jgi:hypothetical protein
MEMPLRLKSHEELLDVLSGSTCYKAIELIHHLMWILPHPHYIQKRIDFLFAYFVNSYA